MKVVILAGGHGTRISEESQVKPKPMIEIGQKPILWHIMKMYSVFGFNDFIICLGYKGHLIKEYFAHYFLHEADVTFDFSKGNRQCIHANTAEPWRVTLVETGLDTMTGGRLKRARKYIGRETFMLTYGDGVGTVDMRKLLQYHKSHGRKVTVTATQPAGRFGVLNIDQSDTVTNFTEKPKSNSAWINIGYFVMEPEFIDSISDDSTILEKAPLEKAARAGELKAYKHNGFWHPMDKLSDKVALEKLWTSGKAPWKVW